VEVRFNKGLTSQDHAISEVANPAPQAFGQGEFAVLLVNDGLSGGQVKGRPLGFGVQASVHKEVLAILAADFFPGGSL
jgi:hypothetical protein